MTIPDQIQSLHRLYVTLTGLNVSLDMDYGRQAAWASFIKHGFTEDDLRLVVEHLKRKKARGEMVRSFTFHRFIGQLDYFEEDLAEARAIGRRPRPDAGKESVLRATHRAGEVVKDTSHNTAEVLASPAFKELVKLKETL